MTADDLTRRAREWARELPEHIGEPVPALLSELADEVDRRQEVLERLTHALDDLLAERDAARAALERVRAALDAADEAHNADPALRDLIRDIDGHPFQAHVTVDAIARALEGES